MVISLLFIQGITSFSADTVKRQKESLENAVMRSGSIFSWNTGSSFKAFTSSMLRSGFKPLLKVRAMPLAKRQAAIFS